jgi:hypothetical protein
MLRNWKRFLFFSITFTNYIIILQMMWRYMVPAPQPSWQQSLQPPSRSPHPHSLHLSFPCYKLPPHSYCSFPLDLSHHIPFSHALSPFHPAFSNAISYSFAPSPPRSCLLYIYQDLRQVGPNFPPWTTLLDQFMGLGGNFEYLVNQSANVATWGGATAVPRNNRCIYSDEEALTNPTEISTKQKNKFYAVSPAGP